MSTNNPCLNYLLIDEDVHKLLASRRRIADIWWTEDVQTIRPDLNADDAWKVLEECQRRLDPSCGLTWILLETVAADLFPTTDRFQETTSPCHE